MVPSLKEIFKRKEEKKKKGLRSPVKEIGKGKRTKKTPSVDSFGDPSRKEGREKIKNKIDKMPKEIGSKSLRKSMSQKKRLKEIAERKGRQEKAEKFEKQIEGLEKVRKELSEKAKKS